MKKLIAPLTLLLTIIFTGCIKNTPVTNSDSKVEFDAATWNANAVGVNYPIMSQVPTPGAAGGGAAISRTSGTFRIRVNLLGPQRSSPAVFSFRVVPSETTAVSGVHYAPLPAVGSIPANSSFGYIDIPVLNPGVAGTPVTLVLELLSNDNFAANTNYAKIGFSIAQ